MNDERKYKKVCYILFSILVVVVIFTSVIIYKQTDRIKNVESRIDNNLYNDPDNDHIISSEDSLDIYFEDSNESKQTSNISKIEEKNNIKKDSKEEDKESESVVINYLKDKYEILKQSITKDNAKKVFIEIVDFLFYNGKIKGYTFNELSSKVKVEASNICTNIEIEIYKRFPDVIDNTKSKYKEKKNYFINIYNESIDKYCSDNRKKCDDIKNDYDKIKEKFNKTFIYLKENGKRGIDNIKIKFDNFYSKFKNR